MPTVILGNVAPCQAVYPDEDAAAEGRFEKQSLDLEQSETTFSIPPGEPLGDSLTTVTKTFASMHSDAPPAWVESDSAALATLLAEQYGIPVGRPKDWKGSESSSVVPPKKEHEAVAAPPEDDEE